MQIRSDTDLGTTVFYTLWKPGLHVKIAINVTQKDSPLSCPGTILLGFDPKLGLMQHTSFSLTCLVNGPRKYC